MHPIATPDAPAALGPYAQAVELDGWVFTSGQVGQTESGDIPEGIVAQTELAWSNLRKVLEASGMGLEHLVHVNGYLTRREDLDLFFETRKPHMLPGRPTATLVIVSGLAHRDWLVEIEGYAAAPT